MKHTTKIIPILLCVCAILSLLSGCSSSSSHIDTQNTTIERAAINYAVPVDSFDINKNVAVEVLNHSPDFLYGYDNATELSEVSPIVVIATAIDIKYVDDNANAITLVDVEIEKCIRGNLVPGDIISIEEYGGYVRGDVYDKVYGDSKLERPLTADDILVYEYFGGAPAPQIGDKYILFIGHDAIVEGAYCCIGLFMGKYIIDGDTVYRYFPENEPFFYDSEIPEKTIDDVLQQVENTPFNGDLFFERFNIKPEDAS